MPSPRRPLALLAAGATLALVPALLPSAVASAAPGGARSAPPGAADPTGAGDPGRWSVVGLGDGSYEVAWTAPSPLPATSDRPTIAGDGLTFGPPTVDDDGRTVRATVAAGTAPDPAALDVLLSGDRLDEAGFDPARTTSGATPPRRETTPLPAPDPGVAGPHATVTSDYDLAGVKVAGLPEKVEMVGHVVEPAAGAATGPRPLVLFMHGRHEVCYDLDGGDDYVEKWPCPRGFGEIPSHLGYDYAQRVLASQGYATVSVRVNGINAQDHRLPDGGADARARLVRAHLDHWTGLAAAHQVDLDEVVLVGHSRGGEGVDRASIEIPLSAPYRIAGQVLLAPTDFASHTAPYVPTVTVLPYCDGDVYDIQGQKFTDTARDLAADDTSLKSSVLVMGANHNFFNTEWTPGTAAAPSFDDWGGERDEPCGRRHPDRLKPAQQRAFGKAWIAGAVHLFTGDDAYLPMFDGTATSVPSAGRAESYSHAIGGGRAIRRPGLDASLTTPSAGAETQLCRGTVGRAEAATTCGRSSGGDVTPHWSYPGEGAPVRSFLEMSWTRSGATGGLRLSSPLDLSTDRLELRTIVDPRAKGTRLRVRVADGSGGSATLDPVGGRALPPLLVASNLTKYWAQALLVDPSGATGVDLTDVRTVELVSASARGRVWVADLSAAPATLAAVPDRRLPTVDVGALRIDEGDRTGRRVAKVPFTLTGDVSRPGRLVALVTGQGRRDRKRVVIDVAAGQTRGTIPVEYRANRVHDMLQQSDVAVWPLRNVATDDYLGRLRVTDDDPAPTARLRTVRSTVAEGTSITYRLTLSEPVGYDVYVAGRVVLGRGEPLRGYDVDRRWFERLHGDSDERSLREPLAENYIDVGGVVRAGKRQLTMTVPVVRDGVREGREQLTVRFRAGDLLRTTSRVVVVDTLPARG